MKDAFNNFLQLFHAFCVKVEKYGEVHAFRPTCYGQVHPNLKAVCSKIFMCNSTHRFVKKLSCFSQIGLTLLYYEHFVFIKSQFCYKMFTLNKLENGSIPKNPWFALIIISPSLFLHKSSPKPGIRFIFI